MEIRYIVFSPDEARNAIVAFVMKQGLATTVNDVASIEFGGEQAEPFATVQLRQPPATRPIKLGMQHLSAALLLYCGDRRIPLPKRAHKSIELSIHGLTMVMTTEPEHGGPRVADDRVSYGAAAARATQEISTTRSELVRALARADYAEKQIAQAEESARRSEAARAKSAAALVKVAMAPGLRGSIGRWLVGFGMTHLKEIT